MKRSFLFGLLFLLAPSVVLAATEQTSPGFGLSNPSMSPNVFMGSSAGFQVTGFFEVMAENQQSGSFQAHIGFPLAPPAAAAPTPTPTPGGGGGGGGYIIEPLLPAPVVQYKTPTWKPFQFLRGVRPRATTEVVVNGSSAGVKTYADGTWEQQVPLFLGDNVFDVYFREGSARASSTVAVIHRRLIGDVNDNHRVDDIDLSLFTRLWKKSAFAADFNEDGVVDDFDLSLLAAYWGKSY